MSFVTPRLKAAALGVIAAAFARGQGGGGDGAEYAPLRTSSAGDGGDAA